MRDYLKQLVPNDFEDIVSMNALYRPGALGMNMVDFLISIESMVKKKSPMDMRRLKKYSVLRVIVYQEQSCR